MSKGPSSAWESRIREMRSRFLCHYTEFLLSVFHPNWEFRREAAWALGLAGCRKALPILKQMADEGLEERSGYDNLEDIMEMID